MTERSKLACDAPSRRAGLKIVLASAVGAAATLLGSEPARAGYGACSVKYCECKGYVGQQNNCDRDGCGHRYRDHW